MIDTEALRKKVIDLAIQGKLTEQLQTDGDAETLYAQIQEEKAKLVKEGKIKKDKPLSEITDEEILFEIPNSWKWVRLGELCLQITDGTHKTPVYQNEGVPFLSVKNISSGTFDLKDIKYISEEEHAELIKRCKPEKNDVLVCRIGTLGKAITIDIDLEFSIFVSLGLIKTTDKIVSDYIVQVINSGYGEAWIKDNKAGGAMHTYKINLNSLALLPVPLAPLSEIERILRLNDEVKTHIENISNLQAKYSNDLATLKSKIIDAGIRGKLTEQLSDDGDAESLYAQIQEEKAKLLKEGKIKKEKPLGDITDDEIPFEIPKNWKWVRFGNASNIIGTGLIRSGQEQFEKADCYYFKMNNMGNFDGKCDYDNMVMVNVSEEEYSKFKLQEGDFLFNTRNSVELVGKSVVINEMPYENIVFNNNILKIRFLEKSIANYIGYYFISSYGKNALKQFVSSTTNVAAIYQRQIITLPIPLPPLKEQERIVEKIESLLELI